MLRSKEIFFAVLSMSCAPVMAQQVLGTMECVGSVIENSFGVDLNAKPKTAKMFFKIAKDGELWFGNEDIPVLSRANYRFKTNSPLRLPGSVNYSGSGAGNDDPRFSGLRYEIKASALMGVNPYGYIELNLYSQGPTRTVVFNSESCINK